LQQQQQQKKIKTDKLIHLILVAFFCSAKIYAYQKKINKKVYFPKLS
jgi:hypothetical protein